MPIIPLTQETPALGPAANTQSKTMHFTITQDYVWVAGEDKSLVPSQSTKKAEYSRAILDGETGKLLEYRPLVTMPKYRDEWQQSFGNKIGRLTQEMPSWNKGIKYNVLHPQTPNTTNMTERHHIQANSVWLL